MANLTRVDARARAALIEVTAYSLALDLDQGNHAFGSTSTVRFTCREPGSATFLDVAPQTLMRVTLNGTDLDVAALRDGRFVLPDIACDNEVTVVASMPYSRDGQGLHRSVDPADGQHYVYGHLFLDAAPKVYACFDQPDLKAPYDVRVTAPSHWTVLGNGAATRTGEGGWTLATTKPLATYFVTVCAGPYVSVRSEHDGIPLGVHGRVSLREPLERHAEQILEVTRQSFDYYHSLFGIRYPFGEYHQVFVPEFNAGAMENPGCVTFRDPLLFRDHATRDQILARSNTIAHEAAHMWFGDLVTMRWWDDLWLNESFAEYMAHRTLVAATEFTDAWVDSAVARKVWGYAAERTPSTHPVAGSPAPDAQSALQNFDGISYAKGAATLRQLIAYIGDDAFIAGVRLHLRRHEYGNADLAAFLVSIEQASGRDLGPWADAWLGTAKLDTLSVDTRLVATRLDGAGGVDRVDGAADGAAGVARRADGVVTIASATLRRTPPQDQPADRPHSMDVAGFSGGTEVFRVSAVADADTVDLPGLRGKGAARLVIPNASDLTWAVVQLDDATLEALPDELGLVPDGMARAVVWVALTDGMCLGSIDPRYLLRVFMQAWPAETNESVIMKVASGIAGRMIPAFLPPEEQLAATAACAEAATRLHAAAAPGSTRAVAAARLIARWSSDDDLLQRWVAGTDLPDGLEGDTDLRWRVLHNLSSRGLVGDDEIDAALALDNTMEGGLHALEAKASRPDAAAKARAWEQLTGDHGRSNYEMIALAAGFWVAGQADLVRPYVPRFFTDIPALAGRVGEDALARVAAFAYPRFVVEQATLDATREALARNALSAAVRRAIVDAGSQLEEAVRSRAKFG